MNLNFTAFQNAQGHSTEWFSAIPADLSKSELQTPTPQGRTLAQKFLHGLCAHFRATLGTKQQERNS